MMFLWLSERVEIRHKAVPLAAHSSVLENKVGFGGSFDLVGPRRGRRRALRLARAPLGRPHRRRRGARRIVARAALRLLPLRLPGHRRARRQLPRALARLPRLSRVAPPAHNTGGRRVEGHLAGVGTERLLSSSVDGSVAKWDLFHLRQKTVQDSVGVPVWRMAMEPSDPINSENKGSGFAANGHANHKGRTYSDSSYIDDGDSSDDEDNSGKTSSSYHVNEFQRLALACDDGSVRLYNVPESGALTYYRSLPRVSGRILSVTWSNNAKLIFLGSSDGY